MNKDRIININGVDCYVVVDEVINGIKYLYLTELEEDDITEKFYVYKEQEPGNLIKVSDEEELKEVLPKLAILCYSLGNSEE